MRILTIVVLALSFSLHAGSGRSKQPESLVESFKTSQNSVLVNVKGMVCDFCAQGLKKKFGAIDSVSSIDVDLESGNVLINLKPGRDLSDNKIKKAVEENGLEVLKTQRR